MPAASQVFTISDTSPASASTAAGDTIKGLSQFDAIKIVAQLVGATGGTLDVYLQTSHDGGTTWVDYVHFAQLAGGASAVKYTVSPSLDNTIQTVGTGTSPALAAGTCAGGHWGDQLRALYVAGGGTSVGAAVTINVYGINQRR